MRTISIFQIIRSLWDLCIFESKVSEIINYFVEIYAVNKWLIIGNFPPVNSLVVHICRSCLNQILISSQYMWWKLNNLAILSSLNETCCSLQRMMYKANREIDWQSHNLYLNTKSVRNCFHSWYHLMVLS